MEQVMAYPIGDWKQAVERGETELGHKEWVELSQSEAAEEDPEADRLFKGACEAYANGADGGCPICGSDDISAGRIEYADGVVWSEVECKACGAEWQEVFEMVSCDFSEGYLPENWRELIREKNNVA